MIHFLGTSMTPELQLRIRRRRLIALILSGSVFVYVGAGVSYATTKFQEAAYLEAVPRLPKVDHQQTAPKIIKVEYTGIQRAFDVFNFRLFQGTLSIPMFTFQRGRNYKAYFHADRYNSRNEDNGPSHEIALNPDCFPGRSDEEILSSLLHEMVHLWQTEFGKPSRPGYHNKQWANKMVELGLQPSSTGKPGGKMTGQSMSHYIIPGGAYARAYAALVKQSGFQLHWESDREETRQSSRDKTAFICPVCLDKAWGKPSLALDCRRDHDPVPMQRVITKTIPRAPRA